MEAGQTVGHVSVCLGQGRWQLQLGQGGGGGGRRMEKECWRMLASRLQLL